MVARGGGDRTHVRRAKRKQAAAIGGSVGLNVLARSRRGVSQCFPEAHMLVRGGLDASTCVVIESGFCSSIFLPLRRCFGAFPFLTARILTSLVIGFRSDWPVLHRA